MIGDERLLIISFGSRVLGLLDVFWGKKGVRLGGPNFLYIQMGVLIVIEVANVRFRRPAQWKTGYLF